MGNILYLRAPEGYSEGHRVDPALLDMGEKSLRMR